MSANMIIFDSEYSAQQVVVLDRVKTLLEEAINEIKRASEHENWGCPERSRMNSDINDIKTRLDRTINGVLRTAGALGDGVKKYLDLESRYGANADELSKSSTTHVSYSGIEHGGRGRSIDVPVTPVPAKKRVSPFTVAKDSLWGLIKGPLQGGITNIFGEIKDILEIPDMILEKLGTLEGVSDEEFDQKFCEVAEVIFDGGCDLLEGFCNTVVNSFTNGWRNFTKPFTAFGEPGYHVANGGTLLANAVEDFYEWFKGDGFSERAKDGWKAFMMIGEWITSGFKKAS